MSRVQVNVHEAKTNLSRLLERVAAGDEIVIARAGKPAARLVKYEEPPAQRELGFLRGRIRVDDEWDSDEVNDEITTLLEEGD